MQRLAPSFTVTREDNPREIHWTVVGLFDQQKIGELFSALLESSKPFRDDRKGFRVLGDLRDFAVQQREVAEMMETSQEVSAQLGVDRMAIVYSSMLVKQQFRRVSDALECEFFDAKADAIAWLREPKQPQS